MLWSALLLAFAYTRSPLHGASRVSLSARAEPRASDAQAAAAARRLTLARERIDRIRALPPEPKPPPRDAAQKMPPFAHVTPYSLAEKLAPVRYDPVASATRFAAQPARVLRRQLELAVPLGALVLQISVDRTLGVEVENRPRRAAALQQLLSGLGPAIIKAGQALSSRTDLLPAEYLVELQKLQDAVPPFPTSAAFAVLREELGVDPKKLFAYISDEPIAAASLGQVYKAIRRGSHEPLAIKVQRPGSLEIADLDLHILRTTAGWCNWALRVMRRDVDAVGIVDDFGALLFAELDYTVEARNAMRFHQLYVRPDNKVGAPRVFEELTTTRVLVESWVEGVRITDTRALVAWGLEPDALVETLVLCSLSQMLDDGFFHADPHAGNLLVAPDGTLTYIECARRARGGCGVATGEGRRGAARRGASGWRLRERARRGEERSRARAHVRAAVAAPRPRARISPRTMGAPLTSVHTASHPPPRLRASQLWHDGRRHPRAARRPDRIDRPPGQPRLQGAGRALQEPRLHPRRRARRAHRRRAQRRAARRAELIGLRAEFEIRRLQAGRRHVRLPLFAPALLHRGHSLPRRPRGARATRAGSSARAPRRQQASPRPRAPTAQRSAQRAARPSPRGEPLTLAARLVSVASAHRLRARLARPPAHLAPRASRCKRTPSSR